MADGGCPQLVIMYGSAHGNAQSVAERIFAEAQSKVGFGFDCSCAQPMQMNAFKKMDPPIQDREVYAVFVVSTTGQGEFPENAGRFYRLLKRTAKKNDSFLAKMQFAVLGLGDTNYDKFCNAGKLLHKVLGELEGAAVGTGELLLLAPSHATRMVRDAAVGWANVWFQWIVERLGCTRVG